MLMGAGASVYALKIASTDTILCFVNTLNIIIGRLQFSDTLFSHL